MTTLSDGSVIASYLGTQSVGISTPQNNFNDISLKRGEVTAIIYPDGKDGSSKSVLYSVDVQQRTSNGSIAIVPYPRCVVFNLFGGTADKFRYTLRKQDKDPEKGEVFSNGSKVLLLCVNGDSRFAYILGGTRDDADETPDDTEGQGHNLFWEFNGVRFTVDDDGQPLLLFRGATEANGGLRDSADPKADGTALTVLKDGSVKISTPDKNQTVKIDNTNKSIFIHADTEWNVSVNGNLTFGVGKDINISGNQLCTLTLKGNIVLKSAGVKVGAAREAWMLGTTYRARQAQLHSELAGYFSAANGLIATAGTGVAALPGGIAAGGALTALAAVMTQISSALNSFEAEADSYISKKNFGD